MDIKLVGIYGLTGLSMIIGLYLMVNYPKYEMMGIGILGLGLILTVWITSTEMRAKYLENFRTAAKINSSGRYNV